MVVSLCCIMSAHLAGECPSPLDFVSYAFITACISFNLLMFHDTIFNLSICLAPFTYL